MLLHGDGYLLFNKRIPSHFKIEFQIVVARLADKFDGKQLEMVFDF